MYTVKSGDTIYDVAFNVTGSLAGVDPILEANTPDDVPMLDWKTIEPLDEVPQSNFMETYTPALKTGQQITTDGIETYNVEATTIAASRPFNSSVDDYNEVMRQIRYLVHILDSLLATETGTYITTETENYIIANVPE